MKSGKAALVGLGAGVVTLGVVVAIMMSGNKAKAAPAGPTPTAIDKQRGYQVLPGCQVVVLDEKKALQTAAMTGASPAIPFEDALLNAFEGCDPTEAVDAALKSGTLTALQKKQGRFFYLFYHAFGAAAVGAGKMAMEDFNAKVESLRTAFQNAGVNTLGWPGPVSPPKPSTNDVLRGYQVFLPSCTLNIINEPLALEWATSLGANPEITVATAMSVAFDGCGISPDLPSLSLAQGRFVYFFVHHLKAAAVGAGKLSKEAFNAEVAATLANAQAVGIDTTGWPGQLP